METLFGMPYLKNGTVALRVIERYQQEVRKAISTGQPAAPVRLATPPDWLQHLSEMMKVKRLQANTSQ